MPAQVAPGRWLASGAGERLQELAPPRSAFGVLVLALEAALSTAAVYAEADRLGQLRSHATLHERRLELRAALQHGAALPAATELLHNDLQRAAVSLCPQIVESLTQARERGGRAGARQRLGADGVGAVPGRGARAGERPRAG